MKYANTVTRDGVEIVVSVLPLSQVPGFDPQHPPQPDTYGVPDDVQVGWVADGAGGFIPPPVPPAVAIPQLVTRRQFKLALLQTGLLDAVEAAVAASADRALQISWQDALDFERHNPLVTAMATALGKTEADLDAIFTLAKTK